jgi:FkbM family methyltransferase
MIGQFKRLIPPGARRRIRPYYRWAATVGSRCRLYRRSRDWHAFSPTIGLSRRGSFVAAYRPGTADEAVLAHSFDQDIFFPGIPEYTPRPGHVIVDVGAHIGTFSLLAAAKARGGRVLALEPCADTFRLLRYNRLLNGAHEIEPHRVALTDTDGHARLHYDEGGNWGHSITAQLSNRGEDVPTVHLNTLFLINHINYCNFIKFNCEGAEFQVLLGCDSDLLGRIGVILCLYHSDLSGRSVDDLRDHLSRNGFETSIRNREEQRGWLIALNTRPAFAAAVLNSH